MKRQKVTVGWREWIRMPDLGVRLIKVKVDTGARTSALHVDDLEYLGRNMLRFRVHPKQRTMRGSVTALATMVDERRVVSSNGKAETRPVINTRIDLGGDIWEIEITLTSRDVMGFRMLLGRQAIRGKAIVDPARSFLTRKVKRKKRAG